MQAALTNTLAYGASSMSFAAQELGGQLEALEEKLAAKGKEEAKLLAKQKSNKESISSENRRLKQLEKSKKEVSLILLILI